MAQDRNIYEVVCRMNGHDLFVLGAMRADGAQVALCKKCGTEIVIGQAPNECGHGLREQRSTGWTLEHGGVVELITCSVCNRKNWKLNREGLPSASTPSLTGSTA